MSSLTVTKVLGDISQYVTNPGKIQRAAMAAFSSINDGTIDIVDATNPLAWAIENASVNLAAFAVQAQALTRRQYPAAAQTSEDLYFHMSDVDYVGLFALPSVAKFTLMIPLLALNNALVLDSSTGIYSVTIPRNTEFIVDKTVFSLQYPVIIRRLQYGGLQIVYDATVISPLQTLSTNVIDFETFKDPNGIDYIQFQLDTQQFNIITKQSTVDFASGGYVSSVAFTDQFYYARVYCADSNGHWKEIKTTYTDQVYDINTPTAVIKVVDKVCKVSIPLVYLTNGLVSGAIRVDCYQTLGDVTIPLKDLNLNVYTANFKAIDNNDVNASVTAFQKLSSVYSFSTDIASGGRNSLSFADTQSRVITNSIGPKNIPITPSQIETAMIDLGYTMVKGVDTITNRKYLATKALPMPNNKNLTTPANASVITYITDLQTVSNVYGCTEHSTGVTITPKALFQLDNGQSTGVTNISMAGLLALPANQKALAFNQGNYVYSPFYYVMDNSNISTFAVRPYYLDSPLIENRAFIQENPSTGVQVSMDSTFTLKKVDTGYRLWISTKSSDSYKQLADTDVFCQLSFLSPDLKVRAYLLGVQQPRLNSSAERVYMFDIVSNYDINVDDLLAQPSFQAINNITDHRSSLSQVFDLTFFVRSSVLTNTTPTDIDSYVGSFQVSDTVTGITHEQLTLQFGYSLSTLWNNYRTFAGTIQYSTYPADVPKLYTTDVYQRDPVTNSAVTIVNGHPHMTILHHAGDPVLDSSGNQVYLHRAGDPMLDDAGNPIPITGYTTTMKRSVDLVVLDGIYYFANDAITQQYLTEVNTDFLAALTDDLVKLNQRVLEQTNVYYYPKITKGVVSALIDNNTVYNIEAAQSFVVTLYVPATVYNNDTIKESLRYTALKTIGDYLSSNQTVSILGITKALSSIYGSDVLGIKISGLAGDTGSSSQGVITVTDDSGSLSVKKILVASPDGTLSVQEDINVIFQLHSTSLVA